MAAQLPDCMTSTLHPASRALVRALSVALLSGAVLASGAGAQSINVRAQGHFYSAKEAYLGKQYDRALDYVYSSKKALDGTNRQLQHLHVLAAYHARKYTEAQEELERFFQITEKKLPESKFDRSVEELTRDEITELTKLINKIDEGVVAAAEAERAERRAADARRAAAEARRAVIAKWVGTWGGEWGMPRPRPNTQYSLVLRATDDGRFSGVFRWESPNRLGGTYEEELVGELVNDNLVRLRGVRFEVVAGGLNARYELHTITLNLLNGMIYGKAVTPSWREGVDISLTRRE